MVASVFAGAISKVCKGQMIENSHLKAYDFLHIKKALLSLRSRQTGEIAMRMKQTVENYKK